VTLDTIELGPGGTGRTGTATTSRTTVLGFGCSALVSGRTTAQSVALLEVAFEAGVRHFDVARSYGTGDAELAVGRFARRHRDEITIATKFGIEPLPQTPTVTVAKALLRPLMRRSRAVLYLVRRHAGHTVRPACFSPQQARNSLATSLDRLATPFVDVLLLHDCTATDWLAPELRDTLDELVGEGRVIRYGTATSFAETAAIVDSGEPRPAVTQFDSDPFTLHAPRIASALHSSTPVIYSCLSRALPAIRRRLTADRALAAQWSRDLDVDVTSTDELAALLLSHAVMTNHSGITLFSSGDPERIVRNVQAISESRYEQAQLREFGERVLALASY
jgi:diketogulonate reductase-like aldo/keto reductase